MEIKGLKVDLHIHTTYSDGQMKPEDIVAKAKELGYDMIAITDHDNTDGVEDAMNAAARYDMKVIPGIEIAVLTEKNIGLHILGHNINKDNEFLKGKLDELIRSRKERNEKMFEILQSMGYDVSIDEVETGANHFIGRPNIARLLINKGYVKDIKESFGPKGLGQPEIRKLKKAKPSAKEAIEMIKAAGGHATLAHPIQTRRIGETGSEEFFANIETIIARLKEYGLEGIECYHPDQDAEQSARFMKIAEKYDLYYTRGSDFHGDDFAKADKTALY